MPPRPRDLDSIDPVTLGRLQRHTDRRAALKQLDLCRVRLGRKLGSGKFGAAYELRDMPGVAVKALPLHGEGVNASVLSPPTSLGDKHFKEQRPIVEILMLILMSREVQKGFFPNFPLLHAVDICEDNAMVFTECAKGSLNEWLTDTKPPERAVISAMAQCLLAVFAFQAMGLSHNDAHLGNFLYHEAPTPGYWHYRVQGEDVYVRNFGQLFVMWDPLASLDQPTNASNVDKLLTGIGQAFGYNRPSANLKRAMGDLQHPTGPGRKSYPTALRTWLAKVKQLDLDELRVGADRRPQRELIINKRMFRFTGGVATTAQWESLLADFYNS